MNWFDLHKLSFHTRSIYAVSIFLFFLTLMQIDIVAPTFVAKRAWYIVFSYAFVFSSTMLSYFFISKEIMLQIGKVNTEEETPISFSLEKSLSQVNVLGFLLFLFFVYWPWMSFSGNNDIGRLYLRLHLIDGKTYFINQIFRATLIPIISFFILVLMSVFSNIMNGGKDSNKKK